MEDGHTLSDYSIENEPTCLILLHLRNGMIILVKRVTGKTLSIQMKAYDSTEKVGIMLQDMETNSADQERLSAILDPVTIRTPVEGPGPPSHATL